MHEMMPLNKTQLFLVDKFKNEINDTEFNDLKFLIDKYFTYLTSHNKNQSKPLKTNWSELYEYKETLDHLAIRLSRTYFLLSYNFSLNKHVKDWNEKEQEWRNYRVSIESMYFASKSEILEEIDRLNSELKEVMKIENELKNNESK